jgi:hypothetical protein
VNDVVDSVIVHRPLEILWFCFVVKVVIEVGIEDGIYVEMSRRWQCWVVPLKLGVML